MGYFKEFISAYLECALWSSTDNADDSGGSPLDENYDVDDIDPKSLESMRRDCVDFVWSNRHALRESELDAGQAGHDFWLTRNGHGAGFWDEGLGEVGEELSMSKASKPYGSVDLYVHEGKVYAQ